MTDDVFAVIAEATRRDILVALRKGDKAVGELVQELEASQPTISKHLKVLREADLVSMRAQGQKRYYALNPKPLAGIANWLQAFDVLPAAAADAAPARRRGTQPGSCPGQPGRPATRRRAGRGATGRRPGRCATRCPARCRAGGPSCRQSAEPRRRHPGGNGGRGQDAPADRADRGPCRHQGRRSPRQPPQVRPQEVTRPPRPAHTAESALRGSVSAQTLPRNAVSRGFGPATAGGSARAPG